LLCPEVCGERKKYILQVVMKNASVGPENKVALQILFAIMKNNFENEIVNRREKPNIALSSTEK
jgi:hypothetical protein